MSDDVREAIRPLIDLLSRSNPADTKLTPEEEAEFQSRAEAEEKQEVENTRKQMLASVTGPLERWKDGVLARLKAIEDKPPPEIPAPVIQQVPAEKTAPKNWKLKATSRDNGLTRTVVASCEGQAKWTFTITHTGPDMFTLEASPITGEPK